MDVSVASRIERCSRSKVVVKSRMQSRRETSGDGAAQSAFSWSVLHGVVPVGAEFREEWTTLSVFAACRGDGAWSVLGILHGETKKLQ